MVDESEDCWPEMVVVFSGFCGMWLVSLLFGNAV